MEENYYEVDGYVDPTFILSMMAIAGLIAVIALVSQWRIFQKSGRPGWASIVPIYNFYILLKIVGKPGWWMLLFFIPFVNIYVAIKTVHLLSKSFGKDIGFTLGLLFLPFLFYPVLAFSRAKYEGPYGDPVAFDAYQNKNRFEFEQAGY
jgi:hypothetical protein